tara:strand:- start:22 stop:306 length:285 start_codon:yes stop_codon:yes gene_type:complete
VHKAIGSDDRIHGAGRQTQRATDAFSLVDNGDRRFRFCARGLLKGCVRTHKIAQLCYQFSPTGGAKIDRGAGSDGLGVRHAAGVAALCALGLRQ